jgi:predicted lipid-binding transport protein (Tim44 family)
MKFAYGLAAIGAIALVSVSVADAARFGGGRSFGAQRPSISAPRVAPSTPPATAAPSNNFSGPAANPVMPRAPGASTAAPAAAARAAAPAATGASRWLGPLAGIATGIGLAALLSHFGMSPSFSGLLLVLLLVVGGFVVARMLLTRRMAMAGGQPIPLSPRGGAAPAPASAFEPRFGGAAPVAATTPAHWPDGFDADRFARQALQQFRAVQRAYDNGDTAALADVMTPELYTEAVKDLRARGVHVPSQFDTLHAEVLDVATEADLYWVSVRFHGTAREDGAPTAQPFDEVWNLSKPVDGSSGWLVAGIQQSVAA